MARTMRRSYEPGSPRNARDGKVRNWSAVVPVRKSNRQSARTEVRRLQMLEIDELENLEDMIEIEY